jgi:hypothetical protein
VRPLAIGNQALTTPSGSTFQRDLSSRLHEGRRRPQPTKNPMLVTAGWKGDG